MRTQKVGIVVLFVKGLTMSRTPELGVIYHEHGQLLMDSLNDYVNSGAILVDSTVGITVR